MECPMGGNPEDCQFHDKREEPYLDKFEWSESLSEDERQEIYLAHSDCLHRRERP